MNGFDGVLGPRDELIDGIVVSVRAGGELPPGRLCRGGFCDQ